jgi:hypothetical protein
MNLAGMLTNYLMSLVTRTPMLLLALVAIIVALARWRRHPGVSGLTAIAFLLYLLKSVTFAFLFQWLPRLRMSMDLSWERIDTLSTVIGVFNDILFAVVLVMLVLAAFSKREVAPTI